MHHNMWRCQTRVCIVFSIFCCSRYLWCRFDTLWQISARMMSTQRDDQLTWGSGPLISALLKLIPEVYRPETQSFIRASILLLAPTVFSVASFISLYDQPVLHVSAEYIVLLHRRHFSCGCSGASRSPDVFSSSLSTLVPIAQWKLSVLSSAMRHRPSFFHLYGFAMPVVMIAWR